MLFVVIFWRMVNNFLHKSYQLLLNRETDCNFNLFLITLCDYILKLFENGLTLRACKGHIWEKVLSRFQQNERKWMGFKKVIK